MLLFLLATGFVYWLTKWKFLKFIIAVILILWLSQIIFIISNIIGVAPELMKLLGGI